MKEDKSLKLQYVRLFSENYKIYKVYQMNVKKQQFQRVDVYVLCLWDIYTEVNMLTS